MRVVQLAHEPQYRWLRCPKGPAQIKREMRVLVLREICEEEPEFGYRYFQDIASDQGVYRYMS